LMVDANILESRVYTFMDLQSRAEDHIHAGCKCALKNI